VNKDVFDKLNIATKSVKEVREQYARYLSSLDLAASAFEELASACIVVISKPYIEVDTRDIDG
jgi:hypothetical protein